MIGINGPQGSVERTEPACDLLCDTNRNVGSRTRAVLAVPLRNLLVSAENERLISARTYLPTLPVVRLPLQRRQDSFLTRGTGAHMSIGRDSRDQWHSPVMSLPCSPLSITTPEVEASCTGAP